MSRDMVKILAAQGALAHRLQRRPRPNHNNAGAVNIQVCRHWVNNIVFNKENVE